MKAAKLSTSTIIDKVIFISPSTIFWNHGTAGQDGGYLGGSPITSAGLRLIYKYVHCLFGPLEHILSCCSKTLVVQSGPKKDR